MKNIIPEKWSFEQVEETKNNPLVVVGTSQNMLYDLEQVDFTHDVMLINSAALIYDKPCKYIASQHFENMPTWVMGRKKLLMGKGFTTISIEPYECVDLIMELEVHNGSSGLYGILTALKFGYKKIVLCGMGLDSSFHSRFFKTWERIKPNLNDCVRSYSGQTRELLGVPTKQWLLH